MEDLQLRYVIVYVEDVARSVAFYERAFGLTKRFVHDSGAYAEMETGGTRLAFADEKTTPTHGGFTLNRAASPAAGIELAFVAADVAAAYQRAVDAGATSVAEPAEKPWGQVVSYVRDLDGVLVELCSAMPE